MFFLFVFVVWNLINSFYLIFVKSMRQFVALLRNRLEEAERVAIVRETQAQWALAPDLISLLPQPRMWSHYDHDLHNIPLWDERHPVMEKNYVKICIIFSLDTHLMLQLFHFYAVNFQYQLTYLQATSFVSSAMLLFFNNVS